MSSAFSFGDVLAHPNREIARNFLFDTFHFSPDKMKKASQERAMATKVGISEVEFWLHFAKERNINLPENVDAAGIDAILFESATQIRKELGNREIRCLSSFNA